jgi:hypothetical protein
MAVGVRAGSAGSCAKEGAAGGVWQEKSAVERWRITGTDQLQLQAAAGREVVDDHESSQRSANKDNTIVACLDMIRPATAQRACGGCGGVCAMRLGQRDNATAAATASTHVDIALVALFCLFSTRAEYTHNAHSKHTVTSCAGHN